MNYTLQKNLRLILQALAQAKQDGINALLIHLGYEISYHVEPNYRRIGSNASVWDASSTRLVKRPPRVASARSASLRAISG